MCDSVRTNKTVRFTGVSELRGCPYSGIPLYVESCGTQLPQHFKKCESCVTGLLLKSLV